MSQRQVLYQWTAMVRKHFAGLSLPQVKTLAAFSLGLGLARRCALGAVAEQLTALGKAETVERRLRRFVGNPRLELADGCRMLSGWVLGSLRIKGPVVLLVDETSLQGHLKVMVVAVAYRGKALPLAWRCYRQEEWPMGQVELIRSLLEWVAPSIPARKQVLVAADRGIGNSPRLLRAIEAMGWYYLVRVSEGVKVAMAGQGEWAFREAVSAEGQSWQGEVQAFKKAGWLSCRALAKWGQGHQEPWLLLTNYPPAQAEWYGVRMWEELAFKDLKSNGWQWQRSRLRTPERAERLWLVMALAYAWVVSLGTQVLNRPSLLKQLSRGLGNRLSVFKLGLRMLDWYLNLVGRKRLRPLNFIAAPIFAPTKNVRQ